MISNKPVPQTWFKYIEEIWETRVHYEDQCRTIKIPRLLPEMKLINFLCMAFGLIFQWDQVYAVYCDYDMRPIQEEFRCHNCPQFLCFHHFPHVSMQLILECCHVVFTVADNRFVSPRTHAVALSSHARVSDLKAYVIECGLVKSDVKLRGLEMDLIGICSLLLDNFPVAKLRFLVRIESIPPEQRSLTASERVIVACPAENISYIEQLINGDTFATLTTRVKTVLIKAKRLTGKILNEAVFEFAPIKAGIQGITVSDDDLMADIDTEKYRLIVQTRQAGHRIVLTK
jgi:hypothetical protein